MKYKKIDWGIGYYYVENNEKHIAVNRHLYETSNLRTLASVIDHELKHSNAAKEFEDFIIDLKDFFDLPKQLRLFVFSLKYPKAFISSTPIIFIDNKISFNWNILWFMLAQFILLAGLIVIALIKMLGVK